MLLRFLGLGVSELSAMMWLQYTVVGEVYVYFDYVVFGQPPRGNDDKVHFHTELGVAGIL